MIGMPGGFGYWPKGQYAGPAEHGARALLDDALGDIRMLRNGLVADTTPGQRG
jgi:hypothetical protein